MKSTRVNYSCSFLDLHTQKLNSPTARSKSLSKISFMVHAELLKMNAPKTVLTRRVIKSGKGVLLAYAAMASPHTVLFVIQDLEIRYTRRI